MEQHRLRSGRVRRDAIPSPERRSTTGWAGAFPGTFAGGVSFISMRKDRQQMNAQFPANGCRVNLVALSDNSARYRDDTRKWNFPRVSRDLPARWTRHPSSPLEKRPSAFAPALATVAEAPRSLSGPAGGRGQLAWNASIVGPRDGDTRRELRPPTVGPPSGRDRQVWTASSPRACPPAPWGPPRALKSASVHTVVVFALSPKILRGVLPPEGLGCERDGTTTTGRWEPLLTSCRRAAAQPSS
jgi:hypothetical protein